MSPEDFKAENRKQLIKIVSAFIGVLALGISVHVTFVVPSIMDHVRGVVRNAISEHQAMMPHGSNEYFMDTLKIVAKRLERMEKKIDNIKK